MSQDHLSHTLSGSTGGGAPDGLRGCQAGLGRLSLGLVLWENFNLRVIGEGVLQLHGAQYNSTDTDVFFIRKNKASPGWCGSVDQARACEPKGHQFNSQSGHMPGLWARSPVGDTQEATTLMLVSLSSFLPSPLSKNK